MIEVKFKAGGQDYALAMTTNAMARYEEAAGESMISAFQKLQTDPSITTIRCLFWAAIRQEKTLEEAGDMIDDIGFEGAIKLIEEAAEKSPLVGKVKKTAISKAG